MVILSNYAALRNIHQETTIAILDCVDARLEAWENSNLSAPYWRLYWNDRPGGIIRLGRQEWRMNPESIFLVAPDTPFSSRLENRVAHLFIHFLVEQPRLASCPGIYTLPATPEVNAIIGRIKAAAEKNKTAEAEEIMLISFLCYHAFAQLPQICKPALPADSRIAEVVAHIEKHLAQPLSNTELAAITKLHTNAFIRLFKQKMQMPPHAYQMAKRIEKACMMLHFSQASMEQIAEATGFCDRYHLSRAFKIKRGMGPAEFRRMVRTD